MLLVISMGEPSYFGALDERAARDEAAVRTRVGQARDALPELVRLLVERYGARRVVLVGSLARGTFDARSDIDLVVEGLSLDDVLRARDEVEDVAGLPVDLLRRETLSDGWRRHHDRFGEVLHGS